LTANRIGITIRVECNCKAQMPFESELALGQESDSSQTTEVHAMAYARRVLGLKHPSWAWYFTKTSLPAQRRL